MKSLIYQLTFLLIIGLIITPGCKKDSTTVDNMDNMVVPDGFTFESTREVDIAINMPNTVDFSNLRSRFDVYTQHPDKGGKYLLTGSFDEYGKYNGTIRVPTSLTSITVMTFAGGVEIEIPKETTLKEGGVIIDFGDDYGDYPPDSLDPDTKSFVTKLSQNSLKKITSQNIINNGDFSQDDFGYIYHWSNNIPLDQRWYI